MESDTCYTSYSQQGEETYSLDNSEVNSNQRVMHQHNEASWSSFLSSRVCSTLSTDGEPCYDENLLDKMTANYRLSLQTDNDIPLDLTTKQKRHTTESGQYLTNNNQIDRPTNSTVGNKPPQNIGMSSHLLLLQQQIQEMQNHLLNQLRQQNNLYATNQPCQQQPHIYARVQKASDQTNKCIGPTTVDCATPDLDHGKPIPNIPSRFQSNNKKSLAFLTSSPFDHKQLPPVLSHNMSGSESTIRDSTQQTNYINYIESGMHTPYTSLDSLNPPLYSNTHKEGIHSDQQVYRVVTPYSSTESSGFNDFTSDFSSTEYEYEPPSMNSCRNSAIQNKTKSAEHRKTTPINCLPCSSKKLLDATLEYGVRIDAPTKKNIDEVEQTPSTKGLTKESSKPINQFKGDVSCQQNKGTKENKAVYWSIENGKNLDETRVIKSCNPGLKLKLLWKRATKSVKKQYNVSKAQIQTSNLCRDSCLYSKLDDQSPPQSQTEVSEEKEGVTHGTIDSLHSVSVPDGMLSSSAFRYDPDGATTNSDTFNLQNMSVSQSQHSEGSEQQLESDTMLESDERACLSHLSRYRTISDLSYDFSKMMTAKETFV